MPSWKKLVAWYGDPQLNSVTSTTYVSASEFIGPLEGTSSYATSASFAVFADTAGTASYSPTLGASLGSPANNQVSLVSSTGAVLSSVTINNVVSSSYALTASYAENVPVAATASYALTASSADDFNIRGSLTGSSANFSGNVTASNLLVNNTITAQTLVVQVITSSTEFITGSTKFGSQLTDTHQFTGSVTITGSLGINGVDYQTTSASFDSRILTNSASIAELSSSYASLSGSFRSGSFSGSFTGSFNGVVSGSFSGSLANLKGQDQFIPVFSGTSTLTSSIMYQSGSGIAINETNFNSPDPEALYVFQTHPTSINVISGKGNINNYLQLNIQNTNQGVSASSDVVATANNGNETIHYIDMGINSENFAGYLGGPNDAYVYSTGHHLWMGNTTDGYNYYLFNSSSLNPVITLTSDGRVVMNGNTEITGSLKVTQGITGSLFGTASWAESASVAPRYTLTSSFTAFTQSYYVDSASFDVRILNNSSSIASLSSSYLASSASFDSRILTNSSSVAILSSSFLTTSASYASLSGSFRTGSYTGSFIGVHTGSFSGSFFGDGAGITNISASSVVGLNLSLISSGSVTASTDPAYGFKVNSNTQISGSTQITGSLGVTGSVSISGSTGTLFTANVDTLILTGSLITTGSMILTGSMNVLGGITASLFGTSSWAVSASHAPSALTSSYAISASYAETASSADKFIVRQDLTGSNALFTGTITAQTLNVQVITSSVEFVTGSTRFGSQLTDTHQFTGSVSITGSLEVNGPATINNLTGSLFGTASWALSASNAPNYTLTSSFTSFTQSYYTDSASFDTRILANSSSIATLSSSYLASSASFDTRILTNSSSIATLSGSYLTDSASFSTRVTTNSSSISELSSSYLASSASFDTRILSNSSSVAILSASYLVDSASFSTRVTSNSASLSLLSASFLTTSASFEVVSASYASLSGSFRTGSYTGSFIGTGSYSLSSLTSSFSISSSYASSSGLSDRTNQVDIYVKNSTGVQINKGTVVRIIGAVGDNPLIQTASYENDANSANTLGITTENIANDTFGYVITEGVLKGIDTSPYVAGQLLYLGPNGTITGSAPIAPLHSVRIGEVLRVQLNNGSMYVRIDNGYELGELHDVRDTSTTSSYGDLLVKSGSVWTNSRQLTGSYAVTGSLFSTQITASSLLVNNAITASAITALSASFGYVQTITGSAVIIGQEFIILNTQSPAARYAGLQIYDSGSQSTASIVWDSETNHFIYENGSGSSYSGGGFLAGPKNTGSLADVTYPTQYRVLRSQGDDHVYDSNIIDDDTKISLGINTQITGGLIVTSGVTSSLLGNVVGNLTGTASYATQALSSSYALSSSFTLISVSASYATQALSASYSVSSSQAQNANQSISSSYALTASYAANVPATASYALQALSSSYSDTASVATTASYAVTAAYASNVPATASYALESLSSSYALTASFALNGGGGGISAVTIADEGIIQGSASFFDFVGATVSTSVTNGTASINIAGGAVAVQGAYSVFTQSIAATTWSISHAVNSRIPVVEVYDNTFNVIIPTRINNPGPFNTDIYFDVAQNGYAIVSTGGDFEVSGSNAILNQTVAATTWSFQHDLQTQYPVFTIFDSNNDVIIPQRINAVDTASAVIYFSTPRTGKAVASVAGPFTFAASSSFATSASYAVSSSQASTSSYVLTAQTASYVQNAQTASYVLNAVSASYALSSSYSVSSSFADSATSASYALNATSASYALSSTTASYALQALTASNALTASTADDFVVRQNITASNALFSGTITAQTLVVQTVTSSVVYSSGSNIFGNDLTNTQELTGSVTVTGSLAVNNSPVILTNQTSSMTVLSSSFASTASYVLNAVSASYSTQALSASYSDSSSVATTASYAVTAAYAANVPSTASYALQALSSSYALTASFALNGGGGGISAIYIADEGALQGTASYFDFTGAGVTATVSAGTASINITGTGGGGQAGLSTTFTQSVAADPWTFIHNLNTRTPLVQVYDTSYNQITPQYVSASNANTVIIGFGVATAGYAIASNGGTIVVTGSNVILNQSSAATTWSFEHNLNTQYPIFQVFNSADEVVIPEKIVASSITSSFIYFPTAITGKAVASVGGLSGSISASYAIQALTASYAMNAGGGISSITIADEGTLIGTASYFDFVGNNISASVNNGTASITVIGATGTSAFTQSTAAATWSFVHNLNTFTPLIQAYTSTYNQLIPNEIVGIDPNTAEIRFDYSQSGYAVASNGGPLTVSGSTARLNQNAAAVTWSFAHNLNSQYVNFEVYDSNNFVIIPANIKAVDSNNAELYFATPSTGVAIAMFSGINGAPNAVTASYALSGSNFHVSNTIKLNGTLTDTATVLSSVVGSNNLFTQATGSYTSAFFKYTAASGSNARSGEVMAVWNGSSVEFTDNSTTDIGTTSAVTGSIVLAAGDVQFNMQTNTSGWRIKSIATFM